ncbi:RIF1 protein, partial [Rhinopomastus cyanomelas]|nr:RIF1 protein [Rhinopomastus cyanomelas]
SRLTGEESKAFAANVKKHFPRLYKVFKAHISSPNLELNNAALQALGFCVFNPNIASELSATEMQDLLSVVNNVAAKSSDKNTRTRALWVISKQSFPSEIVQKEVSSIISTLETVLTKGEVQSMVVEYEALNVVIRLVEQTPVEMGEEAVRWARLIIPLVVHSAHKVQLRGATALEMGMPLLLQKQQEVAAVTEHLMTTKLISELQKLFSTKNETYVLKLWPLFVKLLGKTLHRSGSFINSLLQLEELGFRSGSPVVKKIAFIAWKSLIDNFALNPDILCSAKRLKLLMQPLSSIHVRTEALALTKLEVWWYLLMRLGPQLPANFEQVCVPLIQSTLSLDSPAALQGTPSRLPGNQSLVSTTPAQKSGPFPFASPATPRINLNSSTAAMVAIPSIQLLGIEMLLHFLMGPGVVEFAKQNKLVLSLEPLQYPLISSPSFFCKHASMFINAVQDGFIVIGKEVPDCMLNVIWRDINRHVKTPTESGIKKEKQGSEILTTLLQSLKNIVRSNSLPVQKTLSLIETTVKELPPKVLGSPAYQVADMDLLKGTPALFLIQLLFHNNLLEGCVTDERFFLILETLVGYVLSGPTSPLAFSESVICIINQIAEQVERKEHLWRMWSIVVNPLTEWINRTNEVNQGDALEHNFSAIYSALLLPVSHIFPTQAFPQPTMKSLLHTWSDLYRAFARCAALVSTAEENLCCEELCAKIIAGLEGEAPVMPSMMDGLICILSVMVDCINFAPYSAKYQPKTRSQSVGVCGAKKKKEPIGKLSSLFKLLVMLLNSFQLDSPKESCSELLVSAGPLLIAILHNIISHVALPSVIGNMLAVFSKPLAGFYDKTKAAGVSPVHTHLNNKLEKLLAELIQCLQSHCTGSYDSELLEQLSPLLCIMFEHKSKQMRNQCAHFWNATFAKTTALTYPKELKAVLSKAKKKIPLLLPGFEGIQMAEDYSGPFSDTLENSQLDAKISGMDVKLGQKRDSVLAQTSELKSEIRDKSSDVQVTPAKLKLEFSSLKTKSKKLLEEEESVDFVFIPPETKARVLTEHQKEVLTSRRVDIPAMYNNLDASQDSNLFSQYAQSQEDSLGKRPLIEDAKEDAEPKPQEENANSEGSTKESDEVTAAHALLESAACEKQPCVPRTEENSTSKGEGETEQGAAERIRQELPAGEELEKSAVEAAPKEPLSGSENTSSVSSGSASSDVISGTPQPTSRRQSFITLEKFGSLENRPFSLSPLNSLSELSAGALGAAKQEPASARKSSAKAEKKEENRRNSKSESPQAFVAIRRVTRRQSKLESQGHKQPMRSEQEKSSQESCASSGVENSPGLPCADDAEQVLLTQTQSVRCTAADVEEAEDALTVTDKNPALDTDSKENTPPEAVAASEQVPGDDSQVPQGPPSLKTVRRSSRRQPEAADNSAGSQDVEDGHQKRDRHKDDEKSGQKKVPQAKDDGSQKQKAVSGKTTDHTNQKDSSFAERAAAEDWSSQESPAARRLAEEVSRSSRRPEENMKADTESQDSSSSAGGEKKLERPRYHTRRSSQGLLSSIENSDSDVSEVKEEDTRRRKPSKGRTRNNSLEHKQKYLQPESHRVSPQGKEARNVLETSQGEQGQGVDTDPALVSQQSDLKTQGVAVDGSTAVRAAGSGSPPDAQDTSAEQSKSSVLTESFASPQGLDPVEEKDHTEEQTKVADSSAALPECSPGGDASRADQSSLPRPECQHRKRKRVQKLKSCRFCTKKVKLEVMASAESKPESVHAVSEPQSTPGCTSANTSEVSGSANLDESLSIAPRAMSTPLHPPRETSTFSLEGNGPSADRPSGGHIGMEEELDIPECVMGKANDSIAEVGAAEQDDQVAQSVSACVSGEPGDSVLAAGNHSDQLPATEKEELSQNQQLEETPEAPPLAVAKAEENKVKEPQSNGGDKEAADSLAGETSSVEHKLEVKEEVMETAVAVLEPVPLDREHQVEDTSVVSPRKPEGDDSLVSESPSGVQTRCSWSPSASPSTSILKRGVKRNQEDDSLSPVNKIRRVSFANPIYQEGLADDIDRRSPIIRSHSSPSSRSLKVLASLQAKHITTPTKGFLSLGSRNSKFKSSKKCLITEMVKESLPSPTERVYPALAGCTAPIGVILPQITSNICARGLGQLIRAKNIKTVGDLSALTVSDIKTLPIRSPKVSNVRKALKSYYKQQVKSRGCEEAAPLEDAEKPISNVEDNSTSLDEEKLATDLVDPAVFPSAEQPPADLLSQIEALAAQLSSEDLQGYPGSQLFMMQEKLLAMTNCVMKNLQSRWKSLPHESSK